MKRKAQWKRDEQRIKAHLKRKRRERKKKEREVLGDKAPPKEVPRTIDNTREYDETIVKPDDEEVLEDEQEDEFAEHFRDKVDPKIYITTSFQPKNKNTEEFAQELAVILPYSKFFMRKRGTVGGLVKFAMSCNYTALIVINEDSKKMNGLLLVNLPNGPTAYFKLSSVKLHKDIRDKGATTLHKPELILNNFSTRLGHTVGRMFASMLPQDPDFRGRRVITFHNQRDFIFFRHHRYIFQTKKKTRLQEIGPQFTLKLKYMQRGTFDPIGEYEWFYRKEMETSRRRFFL
eukprot:TRINITY_DN3274_c0_g2_i1.p1 TRINITY_DN3274_c0_g2~~TRINITY_DN3274_c0_g2_i1.p1  ORF type:complete len:298 (-),score=61.99 TRINITY_DN3274_c0_g2_i1:178-1044(-)